MTRRPRGEPFEMVINDLSHDGQGVGKRPAESTEDGVPAAGKTVFVWGALPGERVMAQVVKRGRDFDQAELVSVIESSADRVRPKCEYFGTCGGCSLQHLPSERQIQAKQRTLEENLTRIGKIEPERWLAPVTANPWGYRR